MYTYLKLYKFGFNKSVEPPHQIWAVENNDWYITVLKTMGCNNGFCKSQRVADEILIELFNNISKTKSFMTTWYLN